MAMHTPLEDTRADTLEDTVAETRADTPADTLADTQEGPRAEPADGRERRRAALIRGLIGVGIAALLLRLVVIRSSIGSNDMLTWESFAKEIVRTSVGTLYDHNPEFNHPPLMGLFASLAYRLSRSVGVPFEWLFKAPMVLADLGAACLIHRSWKPRGELYAAVAFAAFCANPVSILISAYHGNTDSLCASLMLLAAVLMDMRRLFAAGLALAASINVKLVPVLLIVPLLAQAGSWRQALKYLLGLALGVIPFAPYLIWHWIGFYQHALAYRSYPNVWGIGLLGSRLAGTPHVSRLGRNLVQLWLTYGTAVVLAWPLLLAALRRLGWRGFGAREIAACSLVGFLVLTPGWGIQYVVYPVALLFAVSLEGAVWYTLVAGAYAGVSYASVWTGKRPYFSDFGYGETATATLLGSLAWIITARILFELLRLRRRPPGLAP
jgi:Glycosyltransferase family 87